MRGYRYESFDIPDFVRWEDSGESAKERCSSAQYQLTWFFTVEPEYNQKIFVTERMIDTGFMTDRFMKDNYALCDAE